jgi:hypothetical protein
MGNLAGQGRTMLLAGSGNTIQRCQVALGAIRDFSVAE